MIYIGHFHQTGFSMNRLQRECISSPVRMAKAERRRSSRRHHVWRKGIICCKFWSIMAALASCFPKKSSSLVCACHAERNRLWALFGPMVFPWKVWELSLRLNIPTKYQSSKHPRWRFLVCKAHTPCSFYSFRSRLTAGFRSGLSEKVYIAVA